MLKLRVAGLAVLITVALSRVAVASADDGEAGLVIQHGDGTIDTYCVGFTGDGITGDELLRRAGVTVVTWSGLVCAIGQAEGCFQPSSFDSCTCQCKGSDCTYWAFFTERYGQKWAYSAIGFQGQKARNGDLQGWKWGKGGPASAPVPTAITFEQVCGHAPVSQAAAATTVPAATASVAPATTATTQAESPTTAASLATEAPLASPLASPTVARLVTIAIGGVAREGDGSASAETPQQAGPTAGARAETGQDGGGEKGGIVAFGVVAAGLVLATAAAAAWRIRRGV